MSIEPDHEQLEQAIRDKYLQVAKSLRGMFKYPTGREGAVALAYEDEDVAGAPQAVLEAFCGVGNPFSLGAIEEGESILDVGCGAGFDLFLASQAVGPRGQARGVDLTPQMVAIAVANLEQAGLSNAEVSQGISSKLPLEDLTVDVVISNGVLNLSVDKAESLREIFRVLKPGGRLQFADIVLETDHPSERPGSLEAWSS